MIRFQIIEQPGADLHRVLVRAMREHDLHTFVATKRGRKVQHTNKSYPGWMKWTPLDGVIHCEVLSPQKPGGEWRFFSAFMGRLADRYPHLVAGIHVQFPDAVPPTPPRSARKARRHK
jgi:hypothetical protein